MIGFRACSDLYQPASFIFLNCRYYLLVLFSRQTRRNHIRVTIDVLFWRREEGRFPRTYTFNLIPKYFSSLPVPLLLQCVRKYLLGLNSWCQKVLIFCALGVAGVGCCCFLEGRPLSCFGCSGSNVFFGRVWKRLFSAMYSPNNCAQVRFIFLLYLSIFFLQIKC